MASYDGTNKSSAGCAQHLPYWEIKTEHTKNLYNEAMAMATPEAVAFCDPDNYQGPDIEVDASTLTEEQWQARRADHLGGSDISAIFGENHFKTNLDLYYAKTGKVPAVPEEESSASRLNKLWGHISEEYVDAWLSEKYPYNDIITDTNIYAMPGRPYITANIDRMMRKPDGSYCLVEIKTTSPFNKAAWENGNIPIPYIYQVRTYMAILGVWECVVVCMFDRDTLIANTIKRDLDEEMRIIQGCEDFWAMCFRIFLPYRLVNLRLRSIRFTSMREMPTRMLPRRCWISLLPISVPSTVRYVLSGMLQGRPLKRSTNSARIWLSRLLLRWVRVFWQKRPVWMERGGC